jgi:3-hydroxybutyryl-CoA dehydrogenase
VLATNTSALSVTALGAATSRPGRVIGLHFFNPAPVMRLVEIVTTGLTEPAVAEMAVGLMARWGRTPVRSTDAPGFIVNRVNRPFTLEPLDALASGGTTVAAVDHAMRAAGYPMGPFELMDLIGLDVNLAVTRVLFGAALEAGDPLADRFRPSPIQERPVAEGHLGRKGGGGFYPSGRVVGGEATPGIDPLAAALPERVGLATINEAYRVVGDGVATAADVDLALRLGAGHPLGPFERVARLGGPGAILARLRGPGHDGPRFVPAPALVAASDR